MKASELRDVLAGLMQKHGDLEVRAYDNDGTPGEIFEIGVVAYAKPPFLLIAVLDN